MATKLVNLNATGIDISSKEHVVVVSSDSSENSVRTFQGFTRDLHQLVKWLKDCGIETIAMAIYRGIICCKLMSYLLFLLFYNYISY